MKKTNVNEAIEKTKAARKNGGYGLSCVVCGESHPRTIEMHHLAKKGYGDDLVPLCANCHRKATDPEDNKKPPANPALLEQIGMWLMGLVALLGLLVDKMYDFASVLLEAAKVCPEPYGYGGVNR